MLSESIRDVNRINFLEQKHELVWTRSRSTTAEVAIVLDYTGADIGHGSTARTAIDSAIAKHAPRMEQKPAEVGTRVEIGQVWIDNDRRATGGRAVQVTAIQSDDTGRPIAVTVVGNVVNGVFSAKHPVRISKILVSRLKPTHTGYRLLGVASAGDNDRKVHL